jgi:hypothetical protein
MIWTTGASRMSASRSRMRAVSCQGMGAPYFDTPHAIVAAAVTTDLPLLSAAVIRVAERVAT